MAEHFSSMQINEAWVCSSTFQKKTKYGASQGAQEPPCQFMMQFKRVCGEVMMWPVAEGRWAVGSDDEGRAADEYLGGCSPKIYTEGGVRFV